jgi:hypothetical protein
VSVYEPSRFDVIVVSDPGDRESSCRLVCRECDPDEPEAVRTWLTRHDLLELESMARAHWAKWHKR